MQELFDDLALKLIKERVKQMIGKFGYKTSDREDLVQEFSLYLLECLRRQKRPIKDRQGFFRHVISQHAITLNRRRETEKRDHRRDQSLSEKVPDDDGANVELARMVPEDHSCTRLGVPPRDRLKDGDRRQDVAAVLAKLPPDLREPCERLKQESVSEVARQMNVPRQTLQDTVLRLRCHFKEAGLDEDF